MPIGPRDAAVTTGTTRTTRSRIGASLRRLNSVLESSGRQEEEMADQFSAWQSKWSNRRDQIAQRLAVIDSQLEQLVQNHLRRPQLSVVTAAEELAGVEGLALATLEAY